MGKPIIIPARYEARYCAKDFTVERSSTCSVNFRFGARDFAVERSLANSAVDDRRSSLPQTYVGLSLNIFVSNNVGRIPFDNSGNIFSGSALPTTMAIRFSLRVPTHGRALCVDSRHGVAQIINRVNVGLVEPHWLGNRLEE